MLKDIRDLSNDTDEYREELKKRWSSLLSYRYIGRNHSSMNTGPVDNTVTLRHDMRNAAGGLMVAPLSISSPEGGGGVRPRRGARTRSSTPARSSTTRATSQRIEVFQSEVLKEGKTMGFSRSKIVDADNHDRVIAYTEGQGVSIGTPPEGLQKMDLDEPTIVIEDSPDLPPLWQVFGALAARRRPLDPARARDRVASPDAALHIGPQHIVLETAAIDVAAGLVGTDLLQVQSWHVMFLARGKVGPFRVDGEADRGDRRPRRRAHDAPRRRQRRPRDHLGLGRLPHRRIARPARQPRRSATSSRPARGSLASRARPNRC